MTNDCSTSLNDWYESEDTVTREEVLAGLRAMRDEDCWFDDEEEIIAGAIALLAQPAASEPKP